MALLLLLLGMSNSQDASFFTPPLAGVRCLTNMCPVLIPPLQAARREMREADELAKRYWEASVLL